MAATPIKAGRPGQGKLHPGYCWPIDGDQDEIAVPFAASRAQAVVREALGKCCGVLVTAGSLVYERFAQTVNRVVQAQCWSHTRRHFVDAERAAPPLVAQARERRGSFSKAEALRRERGLEAAAQLAHRGA
jgi:transposase